MAKNYEFWNKLKFFEQFCLVNYNAYKSASTHNSKIVANSKKDAQIWSYIHARTQENSRQVFFDLLDVKAPSTLPPSEPDSRPQSGTPPKEESEASSFDMVEQPDTQPDIQSDAQLAGLMGSSEGDFPDLTSQVEQINVAEAEIPDAPEVESPETGVDLRSGFWTNKSLNFRSLEKSQKSPISIPTDSLDGTLASALIEADFDKAVSHCLKNGRHADALIIARLGTIGID